MSEKNESLLGRMSDEEWEDFFLEFGGTAAPSPRVVDWELTGLCQYRCEWCWGPDHKLGPDQSMTALEITRAMTLFSVTNMNQRFVLTGGEPMLRPDIGEIVDQSCGSVDETVLSTTGDLLVNHRRGDEVWSALSRRPYASTVAVPLHSPNKEVNSTLMPRIGVEIHDRIGVVSEVLTTAQSLGVLATLRTTVTSMQNMHELLAMPEILARNGVDLTKLRWKIYQYDPYVGPRTALSVVDKYAISNHEYASKVTEVMNEWSGIVGHVSTHPVEHSASNYVIVNPRGEVRVVDVDAQGCPTELNLTNRENVPYRFQHQPYETMDAIAVSMPLQLWHPDLVHEDDLAQVARFRR